eukprot:4386839-Amphidinium_carterae.3
MYPPDGVKTFIENLPEVKSTEKALCHAQELASDVLAHSRLDDHIDRKVRLAGQLRERAVDFYSMETATARVMILEVSTQTDFLCPLNAMLASGGLDQGNVEGMKVAWNEQSLLAFPNLLYVPYVVVTGTEEGLQDEARATFAEALSQLSRVIFAGFCEKLAEETSLKARQAKDLNRSGAESLVFPYPELVKNFPRHDREEKVNLNDVWMALFPAEGTVHLLKHLSRERQPDPAKLYRVADGQAELGRSAASSILATHGTDWTWTFVARVILLHFGFCHVLKEAYYVLALKRDLSVRHGKDFKCGLLLLVLLGGICMELPNFGCM